MTAAGKNVAELSIATMLLAACSNDGLATSAQIRSLAAGASHACVLWSDDSIECWGAGNDRPHITASTSNKAATTLAAGDGFTCILSQTGTVGCFDISMQTISLVERIQNAVSIAAGDSHGCAALADGTVRCWGTGSNGQLGDGTTLSSSRAVDVAGLDAAVEVACSSYNSCARRKDGSVWCWGDNAAGQLGRGFSGLTLRGAGPVENVFAASAVASRGFQAVAIGEAGTATEWGNGNPTPMLHPGIDGAVEIGVGMHHACVRTRDDMVRCWGANEAGQLGQIDSINDAKAIAVGLDFSCILRGEREIDCWGANNRGQLGDGTRDSRSVPRPVMLHR